MNIHHEGLPEGHICRPIDAVILLSKKRERERAHSCLLEENKMDCNV